MTFARIPGLLSSLSLLTGAALVAAQQQIPRLAYDVKESVVKIEIHLTHVHDNEKISDQLKRCFEESDFCVIGTGVRINDGGDVITAAHVARDTGVVTQALRNVGIDSELVIAGAARNAEFVKASMESLGGASRASIKAIDSEHDVAVLETESGGRPFAGIDDRGRPRKSGFREAKLDLERPVSKEAIFAFGFPEYSPGLITTTGAITLAVGSANLPEARRNGDTGLVPVYRAGLEMSPGNSGAPLFRASDGALRGIVCEIVEGRQVVATIVPASEIAKVLSKYAVKWQAAPQQTVRAKEKSGRDKSH